jgi:hypothetical protein
LTISWYSSGLRPSAAISCGEKGASEIADMTALSDDKTAKLFYREAMGF